MELTITTIGASHSERLQSFRFDLTHEGHSYSGTMTAQQGATPTVDQVLQRVAASASFVREDYPDQQNDLAYFLVDVDFVRNAETLRNGIETFRECHNALDFLRAVGLDSLIDLRGWTK